MAAQSKGQGGGEAQRDLPVVYSRSNAPLWYKASMGSKGTAPAPLIDSISYAAVPSS